MRESGETWTIPGIVLERSGLCASLYRHRSHRLGFLLRGVIGEDRLHPMLGEVENCAATKSATSTGDKSAGDIWSVGQFGIVGEEFPDRGRAAFAVARHASRNEVTHPVRSATRPGDDVGPVKRAWPTAPQ